MANLARLPNPIRESWEWQVDGACNDADPDVFFSPIAERGPRRASRESVAKSFCARCVVVERCLQHALDVREPFGVWGGLNTTEREGVRASRHTRTG